MAPIRDGEKAADPEEGGRNADARGFGKSADEQAAERRRAGNEQAVDA